MSLSNTITSLPEIDQVMDQSMQAFLAYKKVNANDRAAFLERIAFEIEDLGDILIRTTQEETNLPEARLLGERGRTTMQMRMFAAMLKEGSWIEASIDHAIPEKIPAKQDIRKMLVPLGPVVVFGASNFPYAYSTAGGDTASALAGGCTVVVKAHPAHLKTSSLIASAIHKAIEYCNMPSNCFQHVIGNSFEIGKALVQQSNTCAVGFTGSFSGGRALYDYASVRPKPIPVFSEMGSTNPVLLLADALAQNAETIATQYAGSITLGVGQFCTNPGLLLSVSSEGLDTFKITLANAINQVAPAKMLHAGILNAYEKNRSNALSTKGVTVITNASDVNEYSATPLIAHVQGIDFLKNENLKEEVFGPYAILIECSDMEELKKVWTSVSGQLTTSIMGTDKDFEANPELMEMASQIAGRVLLNGVPTGVEVCASMVHGGPYPASTDSRFTAVGINAVKRWVRPVCYQNCPDYLLPDALKESNPLQIKRMINGNSYQ
jgi:alpha-ketoglutaric semialdehyde dehydrogenase